MKLSKALFVTNCMYRSRDYSPGLVHLFYCRTAASLDTSLDTSPYWHTLEFIVGFFHRLQFISTSVCSITILVCIVTLFLSFLFYCKYQRYTASVKSIVACSMNTESVVVHSYVIVPDFNHIDVHDCCFYIFIVINSLFVSGIYSIFCSALLDVIRTFCDSNLPLFHISSTRFIPRISNKNPLCIAQ